MRNFWVITLLCLGLMSACSSCKKNDEAINDADVAADKASLVASALQGSNTDLSHVVGALTNPLPSLGVHGSTITWSSSNSSTVSNNGQTVVRPAFGQSNANVSMTATLSKGTVSDSKTFALIVLASTVNPDATSVAADKAVLKVSAILGANPDSAHVTLPLTNPLPSLGTNGSSIAWASNNSAVISNDGKIVTRPAYGKSNANVTMTATLSKGNLSDTKIFALIVLATTPSSDSAAVKADILAFDPNSICGNNINIGYITGPLKNPLPSVGPNGSTITWVSDNPAVVSNDGQTVVRPAYGQPPTLVNMTATFTKGTVSETKIIGLMVQAKSS